jgi:uncharacterized protein YifE (UPF0438 family)
MFEDAMTAENSQEEIWQKYTCQNRQRSNFGAKNNFKNEPKTIVDDAVDTANRYKQT